MLKYLLAAMLFGTGSAAVAQSGLATPEQNQAVISTLDALLHQAVEREAQAGAELALSRLELVAVKAERDKLKSISPPPVTAPASTPP